MPHYSKQASAKVGRALHEMKQGKLKSGSSGKTVTSRKQAIAIGLSEARQAGARVPSGKASKAGTSRRGKTTTRKQAVRKK